MSKLKSILSTIFRFALSGLLLVWLYTKIDVAHTADVLRNAQFGFIAAALAVFVIINIFILGRWWVFIRALELPVPFGHAAKYFFIGLFGNLFLPSSIGGDVIKILGLCNDGAAKPKVVASVLLDRLSGFASIVLVAAGAFIFGYRLIQDMTILSAIVILAAASLTVAVVLFNENIYSVCISVFRAFPRFRQALMNMHYDIALLKGNKRAGYGAIGISCGCQILLAVDFWLLARALHQPVPLLYFIIFVPLICVASAVPSIGGLGVREAGAAYLLGKVGVASGVAVSISLINFLFMIFVGLIGGAVYLASPSAQRTQTVFDTDVVSAKT